ncbi:MAG TPA: AarF/UbiB family protein, partial [Jatrophihabitantaceae bacterium]|nr:AarF/UbiB family protein [Jatrophihabitantaceae bacterium]
LRTLIAGLLAFFLATPIIDSISGDTVGVDQPVLPGLWFVMLGIACALLVGMVFLVLAEALVPSGTLPGPLYLVRGLRRRMGRARRYGQIGRIIVRHGLGPYLRGGRRAELATSEGRRRLAHSLRRALDEGGVTFVKLGQVLSTRRDLLPQEFVDELSLLQDQATQVPWDQVEPLVRGLDVVEFDRTPMAAASVAQVHAARLRSGQAVVVKVRRPGVDAVVERDLDIVARLARTVQRSTRWGRSIGTVELARGFADALREELDFRVEARNMTAIAAAATARGDGDGIVIPVPYLALCTQQVLVMQRLDGTPLNSAKVTDPPQVARTLLDTLLRQVVIDGVFHADPHPGNVLLLGDGRLGLLDFGSVGRIDAGLRSALQRLLSGLDRGDPTAVTDSFLELVERPDELDEQRLERALGQFMVRHLSPGLAPDVRMFTDLFAIVSDYGLAIPPEVAAVFRALATLEGGLAALAPGFDVVGEARAFATAHFADQFRPEVIRRSAEQELAALLPMLRRLPRRVDRIASALEHGRLGLRVRLLADEADRRVVTGLLHQVLLTALASTTGIMAVLMLGLNGGPRLTDTVGLFEFFGYCLLVISAILALRVLVLIFRPSRT